MPEGKDIQIDNGSYFRVHNEIAEALAKARLTAAEFRALWFLLRKTYGFNRKDDKISLRQWGEGTNTAREHMVDILNGLVSKNIIYRRDSGGQVLMYGFNKYIEQWQDTFTKKSDRAGRFKTAKVLPGKVLLPQQVTVTTAGNSTVTTAGNETVTLPGTHKIQKTPVKDITAPKAKRPPNEHYEIAIALADVCHMNFELNRKKCLNHASDLRKVTPVPTPALIRERYNGGGWWYANDWRGKLGQQPNLGTLRETWGQWLTEPPTPAESFKPVKIYE